MFTRRLHAQIKLLFPLCCISHYYLRVQPWAFSPTVSCSGRRNGVSLRSVSITSGAFETERVVNRADKKPDLSMLEGTSSAAKRLRKSLTDIGSDTQYPNIVLVGPRGSGENNVVDEIIAHQIPPWQKQTVRRLSLDDAVSFVEVVLGGPEQPDGLLHQWSKDRNTTIVLQGFASATAESQVEMERRKELENVIGHIITTRTLPASLQASKSSVPFLARIIYMVNGSKPPDYVEKSEENVFVIKLASLESRKAQDLPLIAQAKLKSIEKDYGIRNAKISSAATKRLVEHIWEGGDEELERELRNALYRLAHDNQRNPYVPAQPSGDSWELESKHMMVDSPTESIRWRLLYDFPAFRRVIQSPWVFDHFQRYIVEPVFVAFLVVLFWGPQTREHSAALTVFWAGWWPAVMLSFPLLGRIWCSICPFMVTGNIIQEMLTSIGAIELRKTPKWIENIGPAFAFSLFFLILVWEELWDLPNNGALSAWLLLLITSGAVFNSVQYDKRAWCRHLCPIGAMCRTFGTMSATEVRSFKANCHGCKNPKCVKGHSAALDPTDTFALKGCPMGLKNNQLRDMGECTLCMSCVKNCDGQVPEVNLRPIGIDFGLPWFLPPSFQQPRDMAVSQVSTNFWFGGLLTVLQGSVLVHYMPRLLYDLGLDPAIASAPPSLTPDFALHAGATCVLLGLPGLLSLFVDKASVPLENGWKQLRQGWGRQTREEEFDRKVIIETYETLLKSDLSFSEILKRFDEDGKGTVALWEVERALGEFQLSATQIEAVLRILRYRMKIQSTSLMSVRSFLDVFQELYLDAVGSDDGLSEVRVSLETRQSFAELFKELDTDGDGFIMPGEFDVLVDKFYGLGRSWEEKLALFRSADVVGRGRLNLFEFMALIRKIAQAGIQEIGYGYLPLAWASLTAYWISVGLKELGLTLARLPDTFYLDPMFSKWNIHLPFLVVGDGVVSFVQAALILGSLPASIGLTQKLCQDNNIGGLRFGLHAFVQVVGAWITLYLMLTPLENSI